MTVFYKELNVFLKRFDPFLFRTLDRLKGELDAIDRRNLFPLFTDLVHRPSKKLRSFLIFLGYRVAGGKRIREALTLGAAMEILHTSILIQDDIIDRGNTRRGGPTIHARLAARFRGHTDALHYAEGTAFLIADFGLHAAYWLVHSLKNGAVVRQYQTMTHEVVIGQQIDVDLSFQRKYQNRALLERVLTLKSGRYSIDRPLALGLALADKESWIPRFLKFSNPLGKMFQVVDDWLGMFGDERKLGKPTDSDLKEGKATLLVYYGLHYASRQERKKILSVLGDQNAPKRLCDEVKSILKKYAETPVKKYIQTQARLSRIALDSLPISAYDKSLFHEFIMYLMERKK